MGYCFFCGFRFWVFEVVVCVLVLLLWWCCAVVVVIWVWVFWFTELCALGIGGFVDLELCWFGFNVCGDLVLLVYLVFAILGWLVIAWF